MRRIKLPSRASGTIVQQLNTNNTRDLIRDFNAGKPIDVNHGNANSYDFDDQTKVDFDKDFIREPKNLMDQSFLMDEIKSKFASSMPSMSDSPAEEPLAHDAPTDPPTPSV